jgi:protein O-mannosyl-transferase
MNIVTQDHDARTQTAAIAGGWAALFLAAIFAYFPGLNGPFVVDDFGSIEALGNLGGVNDWSSFKAFVFGGHAGPTGRPISLLTFLIDANNWPTDAWPFKRTNLIIHLMNGALLGILTGKILQLLDFQKHEVRWIALLAAACWVLHPFLVSTTLYAVQRMAQLSTLFVFAGLIGHLYGRSLLVGKMTRAYLVMSISVASFTLLAMLSKENGILLPLLIGVIEFTVIASQRDRFLPLNRLWTSVFIIAPSLVIVAYLGARAFTGDFFNIVPPRDFSIYERMLTEPRILADYLQNWFVPKLYTTGVFQDHFIKSRGILSPITTLLSALLHIGIISIAIINRRKWPVFALAALFFYAGHLLESTVLNLELYFEHRNYLPACFLFLPVIVFLWQKVRRQMFVAMVLGMLLLLSGFTRYSATVWADFSSMVEASARKAPTSARAQADYAKDLFNVGRYEESLRVIDQAITAIPTTKPQLLLNRLTMLCKLGILNSDEFERTAIELSATVYDPRLISIYNEFASTAVMQQCGDVSLFALRELFANMLKVPANADIQSQRYSQIKYFVGLVDAYDGKPLQAATAFEESLQAEPNAKSAMNMAALLATNRYYEEALFFSNRALVELEKSPQGILSGGSVSAADIRNFQAIVRADMSSVQEGDTSHPTP